MHIRVCVCVCVRVSQIVSGTIHNEILAIFGIVATCPNPWAGLPDVWAPVAKWSEIFLGACHRKLRMPRPHASRMPEQAFGDLRDTEWAPHNIFLRECGSVSS